MMSMMVSFCGVLFPRGVLGEILNLIELVSEGFPSYSCEIRTDPYLTSSFYFRFSTYVELFFYLYKQLFVLLFLSKLSWCVYLS